jgi:hypothetical protein
LGSNWKARAYGVQSHCSHWRWWSKVFFRMHSMVRRVQFAIKCLIRMQKIPGSCQMYHIKFWWRPPGIAGPTRRAMATSASSCMSVSFLSHAQNNGKDICWKHLKTLYKAKNVHGGQLKGAQETDTWTR